MRMMANLLTASRGLIAVAIVLLALEGRSALPIVIALIIIGWTTDILDGRMARLARQREEGPLSPQDLWWGAHDFAIDMMMVFASLVYLVSAGFVAPELALGYLLIAGLFIKWSSGSKSITELFAFPLVALPLIIAYSEVPEMAYIYLGWMLLALLLGWERFVGVVREFIDGIKQLHKT